MRDQQRSVELLKDWMAYEARLGAERALYRISRVHRSSGAVDKILVYRVVTGEGWFLDHTVHKSYEEASRFTPPSAGELNLEGYSRAFHRLNPGTGWRFLPGRLESYC